MPKRKLTAQQEKFVNNLLEGMSQTDAYLSAGYKCTRSAARRAAARLLTNVDVSEAIKKAQENAAYRAEITAERILREEMTLAFLNPQRLVDENGKLLDLHELDEDVARAIAGLEVIKQADGTLKYKYRLNNKGRSLERLSRHLGMYNDKLNLGFNAETLNAILAGLPDEYARAVREALGKLVSYRRG
jgi:phage terminase small subunit